MTYAISLKDNPSCWDNFKKDCASSNTGRLSTVDHAIVELYKTWNAKIVRNMHSNQVEILFVFKTEADATMFKLRWS